MKATIELCIVSVHFTVVVVLPCSMTYKCCLCKWGVHRNREILTFHHHISIQVLLSIHHTCPSHIKHTESHNLNVLIPHEMTIAFTFMIIL